MYEKNIKLRSGISDLITQSGFHKISDDPFQFTKYIEHKGEGVEIIRFTAIENSPQTMRVSIVSNTSGVLLHGVINDTVTNLYIVLGMVL